MAVEGRLQMTRVKWLFRGGGAVADEGLTAVAHFIMNVLLVRELTPEEYGQFVIAWTVLLLVGAVHAGFVLEPMTVFASSRYRPGASVYVGRVVRAQFVALAGLSASITAVWLAIRMGHEASSVLAGAVVAPFVLLLWTLRRVPYAFLSPHVAASQSGAFLVLLTSCLFLVKHWGVLTPLTALISVAVASVIACLPAVISGLITWRRPAEEGPSGRELARQHWTYGKWAAPSNVLNWTTGHVFYLLLPFLLGMAAVGTLRASVTVLAPFLQTIAALSSLLVPVLARRRGGPAFDVLLRRALLATLIAGLLLWIGIVRWHEALLHLFYGGRFDSPPGVFSFLGGLPLFTGLGWFAIAGLRALERTKDVFWVLLGAALATLAVGIPMSQSIELPGAAAGLLAGAIGTAVLAVGAHVRIAVVAHGRRPVLTGSPRTD